MNLTSLLTNYRPRLDCVLAPIEPGDAERIPAELVTQLLDTLSTTHDFVVIDTPSQLSEHVLAAMDVSHNFVLLTTPEIPSLKNMRLALDMLDLLGYDPNARSIVLNRADARSGLSAAEVEKAIKTPIAVHVPSSPDVPASINRGVPLAVSAPKHAVTSVLRRLAEETFVGPETAGAPADPRPTKRGLRLRMRSS
jgi:pilus assembly protein CpaE